ncbi:hypothetical protein IWW50_006915, partial [Coemansia erecta]
MDDEHDKPLQFLCSWALERRQRQDGDSSNSDNSNGDSEVRAPLAGHADFVLSFRHAGPAADAQAALEDVVMRLARAGLGVEVRAAQRARRHGRDVAFEPVAGQLLVFVVCPQERLEHEWSRSRLHDWLGGMVALRRGADGTLEVDPDAQDDPSQLLAKGQGQGQSQGQAGEPISAAERQRLV